MYCISILSSDNVAGPTQHPAWKLNRMEVSFLWSSRLGDVWQWVCLGLRLLICRHKTKWSSLGGHTIRHAPALPIPPLSCPICQLPSLSPRHHVMLLRTLHLPSSAPLQMLTCSSIKASTGQQATQAFLPASRFLYCCDMFVYQCCYIISCFFSYLRPVNMLHSLFSSRTL